jgi:nucleoside-diphosphate-sugar epimerase
MTILVAGAGGFVGSSLSGYFECRGNSVIKTSRSTELGSEHSLAECIIFCMGNPDISYCNDNPLTACDSNFKSLIKYLDFASKYRIKKFIFLSTSQVYGEGTNLVEDSCVNPRNIYASFKYAGEVVCHTYSKMYGMNVSILRLDNVFGKNMKTFPTIVVSKLKAGQQIDLFCINGETHVKRWVYIDELASFINFLINNINYTINVNVTGMTRINNSDFVNKIAQKINVIPRVNFINDTISRPLTIDMSNDLMNSLGWKWTTTLDEHLNLFIT